MSTVILKNLILKKENKEGLIRNESGSWYYSLGLMETARWALWGNFKNGE